MSKKGRIVQDIGSGRSLMHFNDVNRKSDTLCCAKIVYPESNLVDYQIIDNALCKRVESDQGWNVVDKYELDFICKKCIAILTPNPIK